MINKFHNKILDHSQELNVCAAGEDTTDYTNVVMAYNFKIIFIIIL